MDLKVQIQSILLCVVNITFTCAGIFLNLLVIVSFWRSPASFRNRLYYFMIMVLSFFDFLVVITNHPLLIIRLIWWLQGKKDLLAAVQVYEHFSDMFIGFSIMTLLVMSLERYLGAYYPFFHRTSLTRRKLLTLLAVLFLVTIVLMIISVNNLVVSYATVLGIFFLFMFPPLVFFNCKLFIVCRKVRRDIASHRNNTSSPEISTLHVNLKNISTCLLTVGCYLVIRSFQRFSSLLLTLLKTQRQKTPGRL